MELRLEDPAELTKEREQQYGEIYALNPDEYPAEGVLIKRISRKRILYMKRLQV